MDDKLPRIGCNTCDLSLDFIRGDIKSDGDILTWAVERTRSKASPIVTEKGSNLNCWKDSIRGVTKHDKERFQLEFFKELDSWRLQVWHREISSWIAEMARFKDVFGLKAWMLEETRFATPPRVTWRGFGLENSKGSVRMGGFDL